MTDTQAGRIWLVIATGGRWTTNEVRALLPYDTPKKVGETLWIMTQRGDVVRFEDGRYGVTEECTIPSRLTVGKVLGTMKAEQ